MNGEDGVFSRGAFESEQRNDFSNSFNLYHFNFRMAEFGSTSQPLSTGPEAGPSEPKSNSSSHNGLGSVDVEMAGTESDSVTETLYVNNLNEKIKLDVMKQSLRTLFRQYGTVLDVVAHSSIRMRGQAFVSLATKESAAKAFAEVKGFPLYGKPIVSDSNDSIAFKN